MASDRTSNLRQLELFRNTLPARPMATDDFAKGLYRWPKVEALSKRFIQTNPDRLLYWLAFDVDRAGGAYDWQFRDAPAPNITAENPANRHAHLLYGLGLPVQKAPEASVRALRYAAAVEQGLRVKLDADPSYAAFTVKNPLCRHWTVNTWQPELYDLDWLADYVDLAPYQDKRRHLPEYGLGRNCTMFENLRRWSYRAIRLMDWPDLDTWRAACLAQAAGYNTFPAPLPIREVKSTAKSVSLWTWHHFTPELFSAIQRERVRKWNDRRHAEAVERQQLVLSFPGYTSRTIETVTGIPAGTVRRLRTQGVHSPYQYSSSPRVSRPPGQAGGHTEKRANPEEIPGESVAGREVRQ